MKLVKYCWTTLYTMLLEHSIISSWIVSRVYMIGQQYNACVIDFISLH